MRTPSPDKRESDSSSSIEMTPSPGSTTTTESTTSQSSHTGSTTDGQISNGSTANESPNARSTVTESTASGSINSDSSDDDSTMTEGRGDAQWYELREGWTLHRYEEKTEFTCHQCNKKKTDILVAMKPENNLENMCCNACFCLKIGKGSKDWNLVAVDGIDHIW
ncbi:hypothetical protein G6011_01150 [Alternaria panax]|uniref:Uncharacterized protein n=1 Tax=Alternaria panax TaxID=48097 RepID=A0AAD4NVN9_9PLEO|nr:hypothetical protein G6011_01150 [Alternaria panax]